MIAALNALPVHLFNGKVTVATLDEYSSDLEVKQIAGVATDAVCRGLGEVGGVTGMAVPLGQEIVRILVVQVVVVALKLNAALEVLLHALFAPALREADGHH